MKQQSLLSASQSPLSRSQRWLARLGLHGKIPLKGATKGLRPVLSKSKLLPPFISITSHQNSSPTEVATVPLAIKIMLGHVMLVCDCTARNKTSGGSSGNDAGSWVVNLERCRQKPSLIPLKIKLKKREKKRKKTKTVSSFTYFSSGLTRKYQTRRLRDWIISSLSPLPHFVHSC